MPVRVRPLKSACVIWSTSRIPLKRQRHRQQQEIYSARAQRIIPFHDANGLLFMEIKCGLVSILEEFLWIFHWEGANWGKQYLCFRLLRVFRWVRESSSVISEEIQIPITSCVCRVRRSMLWCPRFRLNCEAWITYLSSLLYKCGKYRKASCQRQRQMQVTHVDTTKMNQLKMLRAIAGGVEDAVCNNARGAFYVNYLCILCNMIYVRYDVRHSEIIKR